MVLAAVLGGFIVAVYFSAAQVVRTFARDWDRFESVYRSASKWADRLGLPLGAKEGTVRLIAFGQDLLSNAYTFFVYLGFIGLLVVLGLPEVSALRQKIQEEFGSSERRQVIEAADEIAGKIRGYLGVTTLTSLMTGVASALWAFLVGLDLALVWGVLNFLLNYIPVVGNLIGILPPTLYALIQFQSWTMPIVVFAGFCVLQITISNFVYPMLQGRRLSLAPVAIVLALAFWGWVWGIAGALVAVPLTAALAIACEHFQGTPMDRSCALRLDEGPGLRRHLRRLCLSVRPEIRGRA
jgi:AI-2 transport protein TqsA